MFLLFTFFSLVFFYTDRHIYRVLGFSLLYRLWADMRGTPIQLADLLHLFLLSLFYWWRKNHLGPNLCLIPVQERSIQAVLKQSTAFWARPLAPPFEELPILGKDMNGSFSFVTFVGVSQIMIKTIYLVNIPKHCLIIYMKSGFWQPRSYLSSNISAFKNN